MGKINGMHKVLKDLRGKSVPIIGVIEGEIKFKKTSQIFIILSVVGEKYDFQKKGWWIWFF